MDRGHYRPQGLTRAQLLEWMLSKAKVEPAPGHVHSMFGPCMISHYRPPPNGALLVRVDGKLRLAARFVWEQHTGMQLGDRHIRHRCDRQSCIAPKHLHPGTHQDNMRDSARRGRHARGERHYRSKLTAAKVRLMRHMYGTGRYTQQQLADRFGTSQPAVNKILKRKCWKHV